jgi:predicted TIM-barrel fold metal-dependent hydrolase
MNFNPDLMTPDERAKALSLIADIQRQSAEILEMLAEMRTLQETPVVIDSEK